MSTHEICRVSTITSSTLTSRSSAICPVTTRLAMGPWRNRFRTTTGQMGLRRLRDQRRCPTYQESCPEGQSAVSEPLASQVLGRAIPLATRPPSMVCLTVCLTSPRAAKMPLATDLLRRALPAMHHPVKHPLEQLRMAHRTPGVKCPAVRQRPTRTRRVPPRNRSRVRLRRWGRHQSRA